MIEKYITVDETLSLAKYTTLAEASHAHDIFKADEERWGTLTACGTVFTAGYVAGKRAERQRKHKPAYSGTDVIMLQEGCKRLINGISSQFTLERLYNILNLLIIK